MNCNKHLHGMGVAKVLARRMSQIKTFSLQEQLPRLPIPALHSSAHKYLAYIEPLVSKADFDKTKALVQDFIAPGKLGERLQERLIAHDKQEKVNSLAYKDFMA